MLISKIYNNLSGDIKEELMFGLTWLLAGGLILGLTWGLAGGLILGLILGLAGGLILGLTLGFIIILINFKEALPFLYSFYPILFLILGIIIITEMMFWLMPKEKIKKDVNLFWHTCKRKGENILEVLLVLSGIAQVYILIREIVKHYNKQVGELILQWIGYIGLGVLILGAIILIFYMWIKLNELKYKR